MIESLLGAFLIAGMRVCDVTIGTMRTILVIQGKKYYAGLAGFFEVLIWITAMRYIVQHMDQTVNLFGYAGGFALGNILGITLEQKIGLGFIQLNVISRHCTDRIADMLRKSKYGVTILPGEGASGGVAVLVVVLKRKQQRAAVKLIETIDPAAFISIQPSIPYRGFMHGSRK
ncbi:MAG TPA: DUF5698 domain-containing protein [Ignavibacteriales bacterium]|nr:DUF5698 domain-containing protein [Ignavibacteriales bacterium]